MNIEITEVYLRDGLQDEHVIVSTDNKLKIAQKIYEAGIKRMEAGSFVNPARVPQMADTAEVFARKPEKSAIWTALALNGKGVDRAVVAGARHIQVVASASQAHSQKNAGGSFEDMIKSIGESTRKHQDVPGIHFFAGVSTAFICPFEGKISAQALGKVIDGFLSYGITDIGLADTLGTAEPAQVIESVGEVLERYPELNLSLHLHNAHGRAFETVRQAIDLGITRYDSALGGFGGCPFAPGAAGNLDTLELVTFIHSLGHSTGIDILKLKSLNEEAGQIVAFSPHLEKQNG